MARVRCRDAGLPLPEPNQWVFAGGHLYRVELLLEGYATIVEVDGKTKYAESDTLRTLYEEKRREDQIREAGFEVVRLTAAETFRSPEVFAPRIRAAFSRALARYGSQEAAS